VACNEELSVSMAFLPLRLGYLLQLPKPYHNRLKPSREMTVNHLVAGSIPARAAISSTQHRMNDKKLVGSVTR